MTTANVAIAFFALLVVSALLSIAADEWCTRRDRRTTLILRQQSAQHEREREWARTYYELAHRGLAQDFDADSARLRVLELEAELRAKQFYDQDSA